MGGHTLRDDIDRLVARLVSELSWTLAKPPSVASNVLRFRECTGRRIDAAPSFGSAAQAIEHRALTIEQRAQAREGRCRQVASNLQEIERRTALRRFVARDAETARSVRAGGRVRLRDVERDGLRGPKQLVDDVAAATAR